MKIAVSSILCFVLCIANASFLRPTGPGANGSHSIRVPIPVLTPPDTQTPAHPLMQNVHTVAVPSLVPATAAPSNMQGWQGNYQHAMAPNVPSHASSIITTPIKMGDTIFMMPARQTFVNGQRIVEPLMQPCHMPAFEHTQQAPLAYPPMPVSCAPSEINPPPPAPLTPAPTTTPMHANIPRSAHTPPDLRESPQSTASYASINGDTTFNPHTNSPFKKWPALDAETSFSSTQTTPPPQQSTAITSTSFHVWEAGTSWKKGISTFRTPYHLSAEEKKEFIENAQSGKYTAEDLSNKFHISYISVYRTAGDITLPKLRHPKMSAEERAAKIKTCVEILKTTPKRNVDCLAKDLDIRRTTIKSIMKSAKEHLGQAVQTTAETQTAAATNPATPPQHTTESAKRKYAPWEIGTTWQKGKKEEFIKASVAVLSKYPDRTWECLAKDLAANPSSILSIAPSIKERLAQTVQTTAETQTVAATNPAKPRARKKTEMYSRDQLWTAGTPWKKGVSIFKQRGDLSQEEHQRFEADARKEDSFVDVLSNTYALSSSLIAGVKKQLSLPVRYAHKNSALNIKAISAEINRMKAKFPKRERACLAKDMNLSFEEFMYVYQKMWRSSSAVLETGAAQEKDAAHLSAQAQSYPSPVPMDTQPAIESPPENKEPPAKKRRLNNGTTDITQEAPTPGDQSQNTSSSAQ